MTEFNEDAQAYLATLQELLTCACSWDGDARLLGNVRAADMVQALMFAIDRASPKPSEPSERELSPGYEPSLLKKLRAYYRKPTPDHGYAVTDRRMAGELVEFVETLLANIELGHGALDESEAQLAERTAELSSLTQRISDIAWENGGPVPVQTADENLTSIERYAHGLRRGLAERMTEVERLKAELENLQANPCQCEFGEYGWNSSRCPMHREGRR